MNSFTIFLKKLFKIPLTPEELLLDHKGPVLIATPDRPSSTAAPATPTLTPEPTPSAAAPATPAAPPAPSPALSIPPTPPIPPMTPFEKAAHYVLQNEDGVAWDHDTGAFTNNPKDPGGATKWGITLAVYAEFFGRTRSPDAAGRMHWDMTIDEVKAMPREIALKIYQRVYWGPIGGDYYTDPAKSAAILDTAVNKGLGGGMVILTDVLHNHFTTRYGLDLIRAVNAMPTPAFLAAMRYAVRRYIERRISEHPNMEWARNGWLNRADRLPTLVSYIGSLK